MIHQGGHCINHDVSVQDGVRGGVRGPHYHWPDGACSWVGGHCGAIILSNNHTSVIHESEVWGLGRWHGVVDVSQRASHIFGAFSEQNEEHKTVPH